MNVKKKIVEAVELRETMIGYIKEADEQLLKVLKAVMENYKENDIVCYKIDPKTIPSGIANCRGRNRARRVYFSRGLGKRSRKLVRETYSISFLHLLPLALA